MWLSVADIRNKFSIVAGRYDNQIEAASNSAALVLQTSLSDTLYSEAESEEPDPLTISYSRIVEAHSYLTMWFLIGNVGNKLSADGFVKSQQDSASPAQGSRVVTNSYLTPKELATMRAEFLEMARLHLGDYGVIDIVAESQTSVITYPSVSVPIRADW